MIRSGFLLCATLICMQVFQFQSASGLDELKLRMYSQRGRNPYALYNQMPPNLRKIENSASISIKYEGTGNSWIYQEEEERGSRVNNDSKLEEVTMAPKLTTEAKPVIRVKVAALFRNNIIRAFGYILHRYKIELDSVLYTSLYFIWTTAKFNQIDIFGMLPILSELSFKTPNERFLAIFETMETHLPEYLRCSATVWKEAIKKKVVNMDVIFKPTENSALVVDVLQGMDEIMLFEIATDAKIEEPKDEAEKSIVFNLNRNVLHLMRYIKANKANIKQVFLGALITHFPRSLIQPHLEESIALVTQYLDQNIIEGWDKSVSGIPNDIIENPYSFVKYFMSNLRKNSNVPYEIKVALQILYDDLDNRNPTAINPHYNSISEIVDVDNVRIDFMLAYIRRELYPLEIVLAANRLSYYLKSNNIRHLTLKMMLNPYQYTSPTELLLAILFRIIKRQPDLALEILNSARAVYIHVWYMYRYTYSPAVISDEMADIDTLTTGLRPPDVDKTFVDHLDKVTTDISAEDIDYHKMLSEVLVQKCATPIDCFVQLLIIIKEKRQSLEDSINTFFVYMDTRKTINITAVVNTTLFPPAYADCVFTDTCIPELPDPILPPTEGPVTTPTTLPSTPATTPTTPTPTKNPSQNTIDPGFNEPGNGSSVNMELLLNQTETDEEKRYVKILINILESKEYEDKLKKSQHIPIISTYLMILNEMNASKSDTQITEDVHKFLSKFIIKLSQVQAILRQIAVEQVPKIPVTMRLIIAVPAPSTDEERGQFETLKQILANQKLFETLYGNLNNQDFSTVGTLLKAILKLEVTDKGITAKQRDVIKYYLDKVESSGIAASKVEYGVKVDVLQQKVDFSGNMDKAIGFSSLDANHQKMFNRIIQYLVDVPSVYHYWDKWVYYSTAAEFTKGIYNHILEKSNVPKDVRDAINALMPLIKNDGAAKDSAF